MISLKQVEGFHWVAVLGGVERAARHLNATQSAISKRVQELEAALRIRLLDRSQRRVRLTPDGERLLVLAREMLATRARMTELGETSEPTVHMLRVGVTELTAMTWLSALTERVQLLPGPVALEPHVDASANLVQRLRDDTLDLAVVPDAFQDPLFRTVPLDLVEYAWMCRPGYVELDRPLPVRDLPRFTIIDQVHASGLGDLVRRWLLDRHVGPISVLPSSSLSAVAALTTAGHGISYLPLRMFEPLLSSGRLNVVETRPKLPRIPYVLMMKKARDDETLATMVSTVAECCDFTRSVLHG